MTIEGRLREYRESAASARGLEPTLVARIDRAIKLAEARGPRVFTEQPMVLAQGLQDQRDVRGADYLSAIAVVPLARVLRLELLDEKGNVLGTARNYTEKTRMHTWVWGARQLDIGVATVQVGAYLTPSFFDPAAGVREEPIEEFDVIKLPPEWWKQPVFIRLVMEGGQQTEPVRVWIDRGSAQPQPAK